MMTELFFLFYEIKFNWKKTTLFMLTPNIYVAKVLTKSGVTWLLIIVIINFFIIWKFYIDYLSQFTGYSVILIEK